MATIREVSEKIRDHLTQQRARATFDSRGGSCRYYDPSTGNKCAVGCLIPEGKYHPEMEGAAIHREPGYDKRAYDIREVLSEEYGIDFQRHENVAFLRDWQQYHDSGDYAQWIKFDATYPGDWVSPARMHDSIMERYEKTMKWYEGEL